MAAGTGWRSMSPQEKKVFYALASKKELTDTYARARFEREPWYMTEKKIKKERSDKNAESGRTDESGRV